MRYISDSKVLEAPALDEVYGVTKCGPQAMPSVEMESLVDLLAFETNPTV
jgi:hypothetical protein